MNPQYVVGLSWCIKAWYKQLSTNTLPTPLLKLDFPSSLFLSTNIYPTPGDSYTPGNRWIPKSSWANRGDAWWLPKRFMLGDAWWCLDGGLGPPYRYMQSWKILKQNWTTVAGERKQRWTQQSELWWYFIISTLHDVTKHVITWYLWKKHDIATQNPQSMKHMTLKSPTLNRSMAHPLYIGRIPGGQAY